MSTDFQSLTVKIASHGTGGGHIAKDGRSLCGIEGKHPYNETEIGAACEDIGFEKWFGINHAWICRLCLKKYAKLKTL